MTSYMPCILSNGILIIASRVKIAMCTKCTYSWLVSKRDYSSKCKGERQSAQVTALQNLLKNNQVGYKVLRGAIKAQGTAKLVQSRWNAEQIIFMEVIILNSVL